MEPTMDPAKEPSKEPQEKGWPQVWSRQRPEVRSRCHSYQTPVSGLP